MNNGILGCDAGRKGALCYARDITQLESVTDKVDTGQHGANVWRYMDVDDDNAVKKDNQRRQKELRQEVKAHGVPHQRVQSRVGEAPPCVNISFIILNR